MEDSEERDPLAAKIPNEALHRLATQESGEPVSVLIQLDLPPQELEFTRGNYQDNYVPFRVKPESPDQGEQAEVKIRAANEFLTELLGSPPHWLKSARAFVATVSPEQLRAIAGSPLVKEVHPNRSLGKSGGSVTTAKSNC